MLQAACCLKQKNKPLNHLEYTNGIHWLLAALTDPIGLIYVQYKDIIKWDNEAKLLDGQIPGNKIMLIAMEVTHTMRI